MVNGILNLDKPRGPTSHDIVKHVRRLTGVRRVGHAGTLDPLASGVLLLCLGKATRVVEYLMAGRKVYSARVRLGETTNTYDAAGKTVGRAPVQVGREEIEATLGMFRGPIMQTPPMFSAVKREGKPLYRLARQGVEVEREPRPVEVYSLTLAEWQPPEFLLDVTCSPGTYIRSLAHDIGQAVGCGAHITALTRGASGTFRLEDSCSIDDLDMAASEGRLPDLLLPIECALTQFATIHLDRDSAIKVCHGQRVPAAPERVLAPTGGGNLHGETDTNPQLVRVHGEDGELLALGWFNPLEGTLRPHKVLASPGP